MIDHQFCNFFTILFYTLYNTVGFIRLEEGIYLLYIVYLCIIKEEQYTFWVIRICRPVGIADGAAYTYNPKGPITRKLEVADNFTFRFVFRGQKYVIHTEASPDSDVSSLDSNSDSLKSEDVFNGENDILENKHANDDGKIPVVLYSTCQL
ncbi:hypothetical protein NQ317_007989 [Molorchus minor]|uniref:Uncharacterized protein n=1 Tax=Molorchus minor TaxID=1323400 RepID=A0ABQ9JIY9_9CUCU|nr:hypothetical protein NQ317_007989 [Molorchus minor]